MATKSKGKSASSHGRSSSSGKSSASKSSTSSKSSSSSNGSSEAESLRELMVDQVKDMYWAEKALTKALPKLAKKATSEDLVEALNNHLEETEEHVARLEQVFETLEITPRAKKCEAMEGLLKEGDELVGETEEGPVRDAAIIAACQKVEHYEIASYGTLASFAKILGEDDIVSVLEETLEEEKAADEKLTEVAESAVNIEAAQSEEEEEEETAEAE